MVFPHGLRALNHRDYRLFFFGQLVSLSGSWMQVVGQAWLILELTSSPFRLGLISTLQFLPLLLFSLPAGAVVDRLPKRRVLLLTQVCLMLLALALSLLAFTGRVQYWHVAVLATLLGLVNTLDNPTRQSFVVEMVGKADLLNAIALNSATFNVARIAGPAAAGLLVGAYGVAPAFLFNALSFLAVIAALLAMETQGLPRPRAPKPLLQEIREGVRYSRRTPAVALRLSAVLVVSVFLINYNVTVPLLARQVLHLEARGYGLLMSSLGAGALVGALVTAMGEETPRLPGLLAAASALAALVLALAFVRTVGQAAALLAAMGCCQILFTARCNTGVQLAAPDELRGRVMSLYSLVLSGMMPVGSFFTGLVIEYLGVPAGFLIGGAAAVALLAAMSYRAFTLPTA